MKFLFSFVSKTCDELGIDESHGLKHAKGTVRCANYLMSKMPDISEEERHMATVAAAIHDLCDSKYTDIVTSSKRISDWLLDLFWTKEEANSLISILQTMSYSKLKQHVDLSGNPVYPNHGKWQRSYEIARNADLLEGFVVARCVLYNKHKFPEKTEDEHWLRAEELFKERVFQYKANGWITLPAALALVPQLEAEAQRCLNKRCMDWDVESDLVLLEN
jgi:hypothetical protein